MSAAVTKIVRTKGSLDGFTSLSVTRGRRAATGKNFHPLINADHLSVKLEKTPDFWAT